MGSQIRIGILGILLGIASIGAGVVVLDEKNPQIKARTVQSNGVGLLNDKLSTLEGDAFDEAFINDMIEHHVGAIAMAEFIDSEARSPQVRALGSEIIRVQTSEIVKMTKWADDWGYTLKAPRQSYTDNMVAGMQGKTGAQLDIAFLSDMVSHHGDALDMSSLANSNAKHDQLKQLANQIYKAQELEIKLMKDIAYEAGYTLKIVDGHHSNGESHTEGDNHTGPTEQH